MSCLENHTAEQRKNNVYALLKYIYCHFNTLDFSDFRKIFVMYRNLLHFRRSTFYRCISDMGALVTCVCTIK